MFSVIILVGPSDTDERRLGYLLESLCHHERPSDIEVILIDDAPSPRLSPGSHCGTAWAAAEIIRTPIWTGRQKPKPTNAMMVGTMSGVSAASPDAEFVLKLDTDALVIGRFSDQLEEAFAADASLGIVGSYDRTCTGSTRDWTVWGPRLLRTRRLWSRRSPRKVARTRRLLAAARVNSDYQLGAHCLGGAYAISPALARRHDLLHWEPWYGTLISEDVVMGVLCAAAGLRMRSLTAAGEPFGLAHRGLPGSPEWLLARGHSIVHSVKSPDPELEADMRRAFRESRPASSGMAISSNAQKGAT
jgi:hypothetical protein